MVDTTSDAAFGSHSVPELIPARMLNAYAYCPRLFHLEWVQTEWADSEDTVAGTRDHRRVDEERGVLPEPEEIGEEAFEVRSLLLTSAEEGIVARLDLLEGRSGKVVPVDYKHAHAPEDGGAWEPDRVQLCAQALVLRGNGYACEQAVVYYAGSRRRVLVPIDEVLEAQTRAVVREAREVAAQRLPPAPLQDSPRCPRCSLVGICMPDEQNHLLGVVDPEPADVRRLYPARDDALPVYVQAHGARVGKKGEELEIWERERGKRRVRLIDVSQLCVLGNVQVTSGAISALLGRGVAIAHFSYGGWFYGLTHGIGSRNAALRIHQYETCRDEGGCLELARGFVARKIRNSRTLLRRNGNPDRPTLRELARCSKAALRAESVESLLGTEGQAARVYFGAFTTMLRPARPDTVGEFDFDGRNRRPPRDPVNAMLSLAYSVLAKDWTIMTLSVGLDPYLGFFHRPRFGRASLALDLMEEFRPLIADSVVLQLVNNGEVVPGDFVRRGAGVMLTDEGRKKFFLAYERRLAQLVTHPAFGYQVSYRRLLEVQARLLGRYLTGEFPSYDGFLTR